jgi:hypothetical protein
VATIVMAALGFIAFLWQVWETARSRTEAFSIQPGMPVVTRTGQVALQFDIINESQRPVYIRSAHLEERTRTAAPARFQLVPDSVTMIESGNVRRYTTNPMAVLAAVRLGMSDDMLIAIETTRDNHFLRVNYYLPPEFLNTVTSAAGSPPITAPLDTTTYSALRKTVLAECDGSSPGFADSIGVWRAADGNLWFGGKVNTQINQISLRDYLCSRTTSGQDTARTNRVPPRSHP